MTARRALIGAGALVMLYALAGAVTSGQVNLIGVPIFLVAVLILHDGVFLPLVLGAGALVRRLVPARWQGTVRFAAVITLAIAVVGTPLVAGFGRSADNDSLLPRAYGKGLLLILILVWGVSLGVTKVIHSRKGWERRRGHGSE
jgi:hypothetical protein